MALKFDVNTALDKYLLNSKTNFPDSLRLILKYLNEDPNISDIKIASYLLATSKIESDYSLQRWEADYLCNSKGIALYPPCQKALDYYRSTKGGKKNYYDLGLDPLGVPYYGRGLIQLTGKSGYEKYGKTIGVDLVNHPEYALIPINSYKISSAYFKDRVNKFVSKGDLTSARKAVNGSNNATTEVNYYYTIWVNILESLQPTSSNGSNVDQSTPLQSDPTEKNAPEVRQEEDPSQFSSNDNATKSATAPISSLTQLVKPQISPSEIIIDTDGISKKDIRQISKGLANVPFVWYNGYQISYTDIRSFKLYHSDLLPVVSITFIDTIGILKQDGFPLDDSLITVYISSRSNILRSIKMDFKILNFKDCGEGIYSIDGICNIPNIYLQKFSSYSNKTSHETLLEISKQSNIGFCSNIQNTDDKMTWINPGLKNHEFIKKVIKNSYLSDNSFLYCYIDYYYNLCYVDLSKELSRDISEDRMIESFGFSSTELVSSEFDDKDTPLLICNDKSFIGSVSYFDAYEIINKSTKVSLQKAYLNRSKIYDSNKKELLIFDIDSLTSDGNKSIIMKGGPGDDKFFEDNVTSIWLGKQDMFSDDGSGNSHKNYNYSFVQNKQNLDDITKIAAKLTFTNPNLNLYKYQKIPVLFSSQKRSPTHEEQFYKRLSGNWIITDIEYNFDGHRMIQIITIIKRELSLTEEESKNTNPKKEISENTNNEFSPNDSEQPTNPDIPQRDESISNQQSSEENTILPKSDLFKKSSDGKIYVVDSQYGVGGKMLIKFGSDLEKYLIENYPEGEVSIQSNGITRDLKQIVENSNPNRISTSKHGAGLAQDYKINTSKIKYDGLTSNYKLVKDVKLMTLISTYIKMGPYSKTIVWGGNFTTSTQINVEGLGNICVNELTHFEISDKEMPKYFELYASELSSLGLNMPNTQEDLGPLYQRGVLS